MFGNSHGFDWRLSHLEIFFTILSISCMLLFLTISLNQILSHPYFQDDFSSMIFLKSTPENVFRRFAPLNRQKSYKGGSGRGVPDYPLPLLGVGVGRTPPSPLPRGLYPTPLEWPISRIEMNKKSQRDVAIVFRFNNIPTCTPKERPQKTRNIFYLFKNFFVVFFVYWHFLPILFFLYIGIFLHPRWRAALCSGPTSGSSRLRWTLPPLLYFSPIRLVFMRAVLVDYLA